MRKPSPEKADTQLVANSRRAGKSYCFNDSHNPDLPAGMWFQKSCEGLTLFLVYYSQACRWSRCLGCNLPSLMSSRHVSFKSLMAQTDHLLANPEITARRQQVKKIILSNNGSMLDEETFSSTALMYALARFNMHFPGLRVLSVETRPEYVDLAELEFISRALKEGQTPTALEIAIGFEAYDDHIRNRVFHKGLTVPAFEALVKKMAPYGFQLKCYFMQKPVPDMTDEAAVEDIRRAIEYLSFTAQQFKVSINMHLNPTYIAKGTLLEEAFKKGRYAPPRLRDVARAASYARGKPVSMFIGLTEEGLAVEGGSFIRHGESALVRQLEAFNRTQDFDILDRLCNARPLKNKKEVRLHL